MAAFIRISKEIGPKTHSYLLKFKAVELNGDPYKGTICPWSDIYFLIL